MGTRIPKEKVKGIYGLFRPLTVVLRENGLIFSFDLKLCFLRGKYELDCPTLSPAECLITPFGPCIFSPSILELSA